MAAFVPVPNVVKAEIHGTINGIAWAHVLHYQYGSGAPSAANLAAGAQVLYQQYATHIHVNAEPQVLLTAGKLTDIASATGNQATYTANTAGSIGTTANAANVAMIISKSIGRRYKGGHPRASLLVGGSGNLLNAQQWTTAFVTTMEAAYVAFIQATANGGMWAGVGPEVCVHRAFNHVVLAVPVTDVVQAYTAQPVIGSQRRRIGR